MSIKELIWSCWSFLCFLIYFSSSQALPLNFRFSPNFDYSATHHRSAASAHLQRHRTWVSPYSDVSGREEQLTDDTGFVRHYGYPRHFKIKQAQKTLRYVRQAAAQAAEEPLAVKLARLRARLAELEAHQQAAAIARPKPPPSFEFDEEHHEEASAQHAEAPAQHAEAPAGESHPAQAPAAPATPSTTAKPSSEAHMDRMSDTAVDPSLRDKNSKKWAAKLHTKHIFERQVQIIGEFPQQIPGNGSAGNATTVAPAAAEGAGDDLAGKRARLEKLKKKLQELQTALAKKTIIHQSRQLEVKRPPAHSRFINYDKKFIRRKKPSRHSLLQRKQKWRTSVDSF